MKSLIIPGLLLASFTAAQAQDPYQLTISGDLLDMRLTASTLEQCKMVSAGIVSANAIARPIAWCEGPDGIKHRGAMHFEQLGMAGKYYKGLKWTAYKP